MASLCGRQAFFVVVVVVLFVCGTKRKRQSWTKAKERSNEFMMREGAREKVNRNSWFILSSFFLSPPAQIISLFDLLL